MPSEREGPAPLLTCNGCRHLNHPFYCGHSGSIDLRRVPLSQLMMAPYPILTPSWCPLLPKETPHEG